LVCPQRKSQKRGKKTSVFVTIHERDFRDVVKPADQRKPKKRC